MKDSFHDKAYNNQDHSKLEVHLVNFKVEAVGDIEGSEAGIVE